MTRPGFMKVTATKPGPDVFSKGDVMRRSMGMMLLVLLALAGCGDDDDPADPGGIGGEVLTGRWTLESWTWTRAAQPQESLDWVVTRGFVGQLTVASSGEFTVEPAIPGGFGQDDGTLTVEGDSIYWDGQNDEEWVKFTLYPGRLRLVWPEVEFTDMDQDGSPEDAWLVVEFTSAGSSR